MDFAACQNVSLQEKAKNESLAGKVEARKASKYIHSLKE
jgi:hypothetical protein